MYVRDNNKCIQNSSDIYLKKKNQFKKNDKYYLQQQSHNIKKKQFVDP